MNAIVGMLFSVAFAGLLSVTPASAIAGEQNSAYRDMVSEIGKGDLERGVKHLEALARNGNGAATFLYAHLFLEIGDVENFQRYLNIAARQKNPVAIKFLATSYFKGTFGEQDFEKARVWYEQGALLRNINSMVYLGLIHRDGLATPVDYEKAYFWFALAGTLKEDGAGQKEPEEFAAEIKNLIAADKLMNINANIERWLAENPSLSHASIPPVE